MAEKTPKFQRTNDYSQFKLLEENREIREVQVKKILASINQVGYIFNPITLNEKMEIIDGQGRYMALKELGLPIDYYIVPGLRREHCIAMNINQSNWTTMDYIHSYAKGGNNNYKYLEILLSRYKALPMVIVRNAIRGSFNPSGVKNSEIKDGTFVCTIEQYNAADERLAFVNDFVDVARKLDGRKDYLFNALLFCFEHPEVDNVRLLNAVEKNYRKMPAITNMADALEGIEEIYNYRSKSPRVYIENDYQRASNSSRKDSEYTGWRGQHDRRGKMWDNKL